MLLPTIQTYQQCSTVW